MASNGFWTGPRSDAPSTRRRGYAWKICRYATAYQTTYQTEIVDPRTGSPFPDQIRGTSTGQSHSPTASTVTGFSAHASTDGRMNYRNVCGTPGWSCLDDDCPHYAQTGLRYFEY